MAWGSSVIDDSNTQADYLLLAALHAAEDLQSASQWVAGNSGDTGDADNSDSDLPVDRVGDKFGHKRSRPGATGTAHTLVLDLGSAAADFDGILIWDHNLNSFEGGAGEDVTVKVEIADDGGFTTSVQEITDFTVTDNDRLVALALDHSGSDARRYSSVQYMRLIFELDASTNFLPEISEVWPFRRRQLGSQFLRGFNPDQQISNVAKARSLSGVLNKTTRYKGLTEFKGELLLNGTTEIDTALDFWTECEEGSETFIVIPQPNTSPEKAYVMSHEGVNTMPTIGKDFRRWKVQWEEQAPFVSQEREVS